MKWPQSVKLDLKSDKQMANESEERDTKRKI